MEVYLHFADKNALLRELCSTDFLTLASRFQALNATSDPVQRLRGIAAAFLRFAQELPNHYRMMFMTPHPQVTIAERPIEKGNTEEDAWAFVKAAVAEAQQAGVLRRDLGPETVAQLFFAGLHGIAALHITTANDPWVDWRPVEEISELMTEALLRGCAPRNEVAPTDSGRGRRTEPRAQRVLQSTSGPSDARTRGKRSPKKRQET